MTGLGIVGVLLVLCPFMLLGTASVARRYRDRARPIKPLGPDDYCLLIIISLWTIASWVGGVGLVFQ